MVTPTSCSQGPTKTRCIHETQADPDVRSGSTQRPVPGELHTALAACALILVGRAADFQVMHDQDLLARDVKIFEADGVKRAQHNPRENRRGEGTLGGDDGPR